MNFALSVKGEENKGHNLPPGTSDKVILGCVNVLADGMNRARLALPLGLGAEPAKVLVFWFEDQLNR